ncbi:translation initiation factor IF-2 [Buchnera aphidicola]|uniref:translation initiation factor IF-2 n=1 Tax=Buchnera aphidicola TaxID=9 RepID=UPI003BEEE6EF
MIDVSLKVLSDEIKISMKNLIQKLSEIGIFKNENDSISIEEKNSLLVSLQKDKNISFDTLILKRKMRTTLNIATVGGRNKEVQVEVRKKRAYLKNNKLIQKMSLSENKQKNILIKNNVLKPKSIKNLEKTIDKKHDITSKNVIQKKLSHPLNIVNDLKKFNNSAKDTKKTQLKKNMELYEKNLNKKRLLKDNIKNWTIGEQDKKDYHLTTFLRTQKIENDHTTEKDQKKRARNIQNNRQKKHNKQNNNEKYKKEDNRFNTSQKKSIALQQVFQKPTSIINRDIVLNETITVSDLANKMAIKSSEVIKNMLNMGIIGENNQVIDQDTAQLIAEDMGHKVILHRENELEEKIMKDRDTGNNIFLIRPPVVTIMGHVDHGKTSLLDYIRSTKVTMNEAGGITQHIGAYHVKTNAGAITFLDTPGHSAFTAMRSRGVQITDIVILVVAADDGVMPQTLEAIQHAKEANVPIIVAINKIDKMESDLDKVKNDLMKYEIISEDWGGNNIFIPLSAKTGKGIDQLLNAILLQAEILELKAISNGMAEGVVIESFLDKGRGPIATVLVQKGKLNKGDIILCGLEYGKIKTLRNEIGKEIKHAGPSIPVEILGLSKVPLSGDIVTVVRNEKQAREVAFYRQNKHRETKLSNQNRVSLENMFDNMNKNNFSELKIILKSDVQGSLEAISGALIQLSTNEVKINIISLGIGSITETDASLALASNAIILGFNVRADNTAKKIIDSEHLDMRYYSVIYNLIDEVKLAMTGLLSPEYKQNIIGLVQVRNLFKSPKFGFVAGCMVIEGIIKRHSKIRIIRDSIVIYEGELESLRRFKEDVNEIRNGIECGIAIKNYNNIRIGDTIEVFEIKEIKRTI